MYIKSVLLDGFKSYGQRTEILGFDQLFNAITGLNGSGKSNILDAICFVLGLSNMSLARCATLEELIYKNGSFRAHKAIVTITFDNSDKDQSPNGYEDKPEIVIRREVHQNSRTKYYVCGQSVSNGQVADLFHSVQLNIANPHFLIMQGRITKVLNMKPQEILAMVEEATGVSMYEAKKKSTYALIDKKDLVLKQIDMLLDETILPKLDQLRKEHANLLAFQNLVVELESLSRRYMAWQFIQHQTKADAAADKILKCKDKIETFESGLKEIEDDQQTIDLKIAEIERQKDEMSGGQIAELERALKEEEKNEIKVLSQLETETDSLKEEVKKKQDLEKLLHKDQTLKDKKSSEYEKLKVDFDRSEETFKEAEADYERAQKNYEAISTGMALNEQGEAATSLADQLMQANNEITHAKTESTIAKNKLSHCEQELTKKSTEADRYKSQYDCDIKAFEGMENTVASLKESMDSIGYDEAQHQKLRDDRNNIRKKIEEVQASIQTEENSHLSELTFDYTNPSPNFNRASVKGVVCKLFKLKDPKYARALETAAGGRLYYIITDTDKTSQMILERGNLRRRHNFIPLNKIKGQTIDHRTIDAARKVADDDDVHAAIDLVEFDPALRPAMEFVFGDTIIASTLDKAMKITYSNLRKRAVSLDGDNVLPGGDMSGGAALKTDSILIKLVGLMDKHRIHDQLCADLTKIDSLMAEFEKLRVQYLPLHSKYEVEASKLTEVKRRMQQTSKHHQLFEDVKNLRTELEEIKKSLDYYKEIHEKAEKKAKELKTKMNNSEQSHKKEMEAAEKALKFAKLKVDSSKKAIGQKKSKVESLRLELGDLEKSCQTYNDQVTELDQLLLSKQSQIDECTKDVDEVKSKVKEINDRLKEKKAKLRGQNDEINKLVKKKDKLSAVLNEKKLEIKKVEHEIEEIQSEAKDAAHSVKSMLHKNDWINEERHLFGRDDSNYPFNRQDPPFSIKELQAQLQKLQTAKSTMQKSVNQRANLLLSDREKQAEAVKDMRKKLESDKNKLISVIAKVDAKKKDALQKAWTQINADFDSIFSTFLPNTHAKLEIQAGKTILDGLEVRVAFGDVWKESLTELSGGQRSLVALSLILALLKFNPAPVYILDEVDAALDQNHTQNTGTMIKKHFNRSQFIIVSLKDDMFRNANVLFKTKFVDGKSTVARYTHSQQK